MKIINKENLYKIFPFIQLWENNKKLQKDLNSLEKNELKINFNDVDKNKLLDDLYRHQEKELNRKDFIENKGKSILFIITLSITFTLGSINFIYNPKYTINPFFIFILIIGIICLIISTVTLLKTIRIRPQYDLYVYEKYNINYNSLDVSSNNEIKINLKELTDEEQIEILIKSFKANEKIILQKSNSLDCTFTMLIYSIILISIALILILINNFNYLEFINILSNLFHLIFN